MSTTTPASGHGMKWFRRRRPAPAPRIEITPADIAAAFVWGKDLSEWFALTDADRADKRHNITQAPGFGETK